MKRYAVTVLHRPNIHYVLTALVANTATVSPCFVKSHAFNLCHFPNLSAGDLYPAFVFFTSRIQAPFFPVSGVFFILRVYYTPIECICQGVLKKILKIRKIFSGSEFCPFCPFLSDTIISWISPEISFFMCRTQWAAVGTAGFLNFYRKEDENEGVHGQDRKSTRLNSSH